jgi:hypothetical protein
MKQLGGVANVEHNKVKQQLNEQSSKTKKNLSIVVEKQECQIKN